MLLKITQFIKEWLNRIGNIRSVSAMDFASLRPFLILLAITLLSYEAIDLFYKVISLPLVNRTATAGERFSASATEGPSQPNPLQNYGIITERNLFLTTLKPVFDKQSDEAFVDSDQKIADFDLKGTVACNSSFGFIFVEERDSRKQKLYRLGDMIGSSKLIKITRNTATLRSGGRDVTMKVKATIEGQLLPNSPDGGRSGSSKNLTLSRESINKNLNDLKSIMRQALIRPYLNKGVQEGYIISNIVPDSVFEKMGLQNGDILIDVNDKKIQKINNLMDMISSMQTGSSFSVNVKRNDNIETLNYFFE